MAHRQVRPLLRQDFPALGHSDIAGHLAAHLLYEGLALVALRPALPIR
jgi:hypothetical protein